ncbi:MAG TPA: response regulator transcription factor [Thermodesulfovibrionales bacterium]|nr:response regulator transcription factor [Thermodesulfovibrionales bacterium]
MIKILIGDDHTLVRKGLRQIIEEAPDMVVVDEASSGNEVLDKIASGDYDVVLLDITMPGRDGLDVLKKIKSARPGLAVLMLSMHPEELYALRALRTGAAGYLTKESVPDELIHAIRQVASGKKYIRPLFAQRLTQKADVSRRNNIPS